MQSIAPSMSSCSKVLSHSSIRFPATDSPQSTMSTEVTSSNATRMYSRRWASKKSGIVYGSLSPSSSYAPKLSVIARSDIETPSQPWTAVRRRHPTPPPPPARHATIPLENALYLRRPRPQQQPIDILNISILQHLRASVRNRTRGGLALR